MIPRRIALALGTVLVLGAGFALAYSFPQVFAPPAPVDAASHADYEPLALTPQEVKAKQASGVKVLLADVRAKSSFEQKHITGARYMPASESSSWGPRLDAGELVVFYCSCPDEGASIATARVAETEHGFKNVAVLKGGLKAWEAAGFAVTKP